MKTKTLLSFILPVFLISLYSTAQDGTLDNSFGNDGLVKLALGTFDDKIHDMIVQPDGKILLAGFSYVESYNFAIIRLNSNGSLDETFGNNGKVVLPVGSNNSDPFNGDKAYGLSLTPDGKIVIVGEAFDRVSKFNVGIIQLLSNGALDTTFGNNGIVSIPVPSADAYTRSCVVDGKSNIYITGGAYSSNQLDVFILKCDRYGQLDTTFGASGIVVYPVYKFQNDMANKILIDKNEKLMLAGTAYNTTNEDYLIMRFNANGTPDTTFAEKGYEVIGFFGSSNEQCYGMAIQEDEKIILAGHSNNSFYDVILTRLNSDGSKDLSFGSSGVTYTNHGTDTDTAQSTDIVIQPDGKIIAGGLASLSQKLNYAMTRYNTDGTLDNSFGSDGFVYTNFTSISDDQALAIALQEDGKILLAGQTYDGQGMMSVARYNNPDVSAPLSVNELTQKNISVWPNPTEGKINLQGIESNKINIVIHDISGRIIFSTTSEQEENNHTLDLSLLDSGYYIINIQSIQEKNKTIMPSVPLIIKH